MSMMYLWISVAAVLIAAITAGAFMFRSYTTAAHALSDERDKRAHELSLREFEAMQVVRRIEADSDSKDLDSETRREIAIYEFHTRQCDLARDAIRAVASLDPRLSADRVEALLDGAERQLRNEAVDNRTNTFWLNGKARTA